MFLWTRKTQFWQTWWKCLNKKPKKVSLNKENDLNNTLFLKKKFFRDKLNAVLTSPPKIIFTESRKSYSSRSDFEAIFFPRKNVKFSSGQLECIFHNSSQNFRRMLWKFYKPVKRFSTTAEKYLPNVGRWKEKYNLFRSNNDPRIVTLDMFTAIWTISLKFFTIEPLGHLERKIYNTAVNVLTRSDFFRLMVKLVSKKDFLLKIIFRRFSWTRRKRLLKPCWKSFVKKLTFFLSMSRSDSKN